MSFGEKQESGSGSVGAGWGGGGVGGGLRGDGRVFEPGEFGEEIDERGGLGGEGVGVGLGAEDKHAALVIGLVLDDVKGLARDGFGGGGEAGDVGVVGGGEAGGVEGEPELGLLGGGEDARAGGEGVIGGGGAECGAEDSIGLDDVATGAEGAGHELVGRGSAEGAHDGDGEPEVGGDG